LARDPLDTPARHEIIARLGLSGACLERALDLAVEGPDLAAWRRLLDRTLLLAGVALCLAGVVCFFAFNWHDLHRLAKLGLAAAGVAAAAGIAAWEGLERLTGKAALLGAAVLAGVLFAIHGQVYQTGADAWELFRAWALLILPWVLVGRFAPLWGLWFLIGNLALALWGAESFHWAIVACVLAAWNGAGWLAWEAAARRLGRLEGRAIPRLLSACTWVALIGPAVHACLQWADRSEWRWRSDGRVAEAESVAVAALVGLATVTAWWFARSRRDLVVVTAALGALIAFATAVLVVLLFVSPGGPFHNLSDSGTGSGFILVGLALVGQVAMAARFVIHLHRSGT
jgi:hypothetical protein